MGKQAFDYYYGDESNQFSFYRIPRQLITGEQFRKLSTDAKLLSIRVNDANHVAALGDIDSNDKHSKHHPAELCRQSSRSYESYPASR